MPERGTAVVVVEHRHRHLAEERKGVNMAIQPGLGSGRRIGTDITGVAVRQIHHEEMRPLPNAGDEDHRLAEVGLGMTGRMRRSRCRM